MAAPSTPVFTPLKGATSLRDKALNSIRDAILNGTFAPGDHLREVHLARELGVSQNTIREALLMLERIGLVVRTPNKHTAVTRLSDAEIIDRVNVRILLEPVVCAAATHRLTDKHLEELEACVALIDQAIKDNSPVEAALADYRFHHAIWLRSGHAWMCEVLEKTTLPLLSFVSVIRYRRAVQDSVRNPHDSILEALKVRDPDLVARRAREHFVDSYREFLPPGTDFVQP